MDEFPREELLSSNLPVSIEELPQIVEKERNRCWRSRVLVLVDGMDDL